KKLTDNVSRYVAEAVARQLRHQLLGADLQRYQEEHGEFTEEELARARSRIFGAAGPGDSPSAACSNTSKPPPWTPKGSPPGSRRTARSSRCFRCSTPWAPISWSAPTPSWRSATEGWTCPGCNGCWPGSGSSR